MKSSQEMVTDTKSLHEKMYFYHVQKLSLRCAAFVALPVGSVPEMFHISLVSGGSLDI